MKNSLKDMVYEGSRRVLNWQMRITLGSLEVLILAVVVGVIFIRV
jgi:hypothetical protein